MLTKLNGRLATRNKVLKIQFVVAPITVHNVGKGIDIATGLQNQMIVLVGLTTNRFSIRSIRRHAVWTGHRHRRMTDELRRLKRRPQIKDDAFNHVRRAVDDIAEDGDIVGFTVFATPIQFGFRQRYRLMFVAHHKLHSTHASSAHEEEQ